MKKIFMALIVALSSMLLMTGCSVTYYTYYEVDSPDVATISSLSDAFWSKSKTTPTKCIAAYPDSTGHTVYLMETKCVSKQKDITEIDTDED